MALKRKNEIIKTSLLIAAVLACFVLWGCDEEAQIEPVDKGLMNAKQVNLFNDMAMENAIVAQHTLYPYHFVANSVRLNELGNRDLCILIGHFKEYPGQLNVQQGDTPDALYHSRVECVYQMLRSAGVNMAKVPILDEGAGGSGMASDDVLEIQDADSKARNERRTTYPRMSEGIKN